jgi:hypothetical protein
VLGQLLSVFRLANADVLKERLLGLVPRHEHDFCGQNARKVGVGGERAPRSTQLKLYRDLSYRGKAPPYLATIFETRGCMGITTFSPVFCVFLAMLTPSLDMAKLFQNVKDTIFESNSQP